MIKFVVLSALVALAYATDDKYTTKYDNVNIDEILGNPRLYDKYYACLMGKEGAKCTPDGKVLKDTIPDALKTDCAKCSEKQKTNADKVIKYMIDHKPEDYKKLEELYDPDQTFRKKFGKN